MGNHRYAGDLTGECRSPFFFSACSPRMEIRGDRLPLRGVNFTRTRRAPVDECRTHRLSCETAIRSGNETFENCCGVPDRHPLNK